MPAHKRKSVAIIGGGLTGGAIAYHLAERGATADITVFEPRAELGQGLAYGTDDGAHRINVPAAKMSLLPSEDAHFVNWIAETNALVDDPQALAADGQVYARRSLFGCYVSEHIQPHLEAGRIVHERGRVTSISKGAQNSWLIVTAAGARHEADIVVLATTHPAPGVPAVLDRALGNDPRLIPDATVKDALRHIKPSANVVIVGTGLTMADVVASLDSQGHTGSIFAFSRRGLLSRGHARETHLNFGEFVGSAISARALLRAVRATIEDALRQGIPWQPVIDAVRAQATLFWPNLPVAERQRIVRHLRPYWDVHRFRIAPQIEAILKDRIAAGTLTVKAASLVSAQADADGIQIGVRSRKDQKIETVSADYVVVTTGPAHGAVLATQPHLASLAREGHITADAFGLGISCNRRGQALDAGGDAQTSLLIAGPLARGTFGELMGLPQVTNYAQAIAGKVLDELSQTRISPEAVLTAAQ
jgi:uncharacterized NAD(P)/FAD-binding protein YdhS